MLCYNEIQTETCQSHNMGIYVKFKPLTLIWWGGYPNYSFSCPNPVGAAQSFVSFVLPVSHIVLLPCIAYNHRHTSPNYDEGHDRNAPS